MTPEQKLFEDACSALHIRVDPETVKDIRRKGRDAIRAAQAEQRRKDAAIVQNIACEPGTLMMPTRSAIAGAILAQEE